ncbi:MAG: type II secretion system F family protein [Sandaracinaceae bacterium]|nr:type II secretion system F family protein [Sandaracinaceae bacterium]
MQNVRTSTYIMGYGGAILLILGLTVAGYLLIQDPNSFVRRLWARYEAALETEARFQLWKTTGARIARTQLGIVLFIMGVAFVSRDWLLWAIVPLFMLAPWFYIRSEHFRRVERIELMLDGWLLLVANALKASPSLGEAIANSAKLVRPPISDEVDLVIKEVKLGTPLDQALLNMSSRIGSRLVSGALATLLVGRQTGGDLPQILEQSAATLREMQRLEGVVRTKTAEGKMQAFVLAVVPFVLVGGFYYLDPTYMSPLFETGLGNALLVVAVILWFSAIIAARRILNVDI